MAMLKLLKISIIFYLITNSTIQTFGQKNGITEVKFSFTHSLRISDHHITVDFQRVQDSVAVHITLSPLQNSPKFKSTKRNYTFKIAAIYFEKIITTLKEINSSDIISNSNFLGNDGTTCEIEFGSYSATVKYVVWSPDFETQARKLELFLNACELILKTAKLDPNKILQ